MVEDYSRHFVVSEVWHCQMKALMSKLRCTSKGGTAFKGLPRRIGVLNENLSVSFRGLGLKSGLKRDLEFASKADGVG